MKPFSLLFLLIVSLLLPPAPVTARADEEAPLYAVAAEQDVYFYAEADEKSGLFTLPYTYYVRVLSLGDPFCKVSYLDDTEPFRRVTGYCKKSQLTFVDFTPARPYLYKKVPVTYTLDNGVPVGNSGMFDSIEVNYAYYGSYRAGTALFYYVYGNGKFGYVPATEEITYELNTDYLTSASGSNTEQPPPDEGEPAREGLNGVQIAVICLLCCAVVGVAVLVLRGKGVPKRSEDDF